MDSKFRIRNDRTVRVDGKMIVGSIEQGKFIPSTRPGAAKYLADPKKSKQLQEWLRWKLCPLPNPDWPPNVPMNEASYSQAAIGDVNADLPPGWHFWSIWDKSLAFSKTGSEQYKVIRTDLAVETPPGYKLCGPNEPISSAERKKWRRYVDRKKKLGDAVDDSYKALRKYRGDPYYAYGIHDTPVHLSAYDVLAGNSENLCSEHYYIVIRAYGSTDDPKTRWTASTGIGGRMLVVPGAPSYATREDALTAATAWWRQGVVDRVAEIALARGGTCIWGIKVNVPEKPIITILDNDGNRLPAPDDGQNQ